MNADRIFSWLAGAIIVAGIAQVVILSPNHNVYKIALERFQAANQITLDDIEIVAPGEQLFAFIDTICGKRHLLILGSPFSMSRQSNEILRHADAFAKYYFRGSPVDPQSRLYITSLWLAGKFTDGLGLTRDYVWPSALVAEISDRNCLEIIW